MDYLQYSKLEWMIFPSHHTVLNLVINGLPSILNLQDGQMLDPMVLNLVINGLPSIL